MNTFVRTGSLKAWIIASRPKTLFVGLSPIIVAIAIAYQSSIKMNYIAAVLCLSTALLLQILSNWVNDYFDFKKGSDTKERLGPPRAMQQGFLTTWQMKVGLYLLTSTICISGAYLAYIGGPIFIGLGVFAVLCAYLYTSGPYPLGYNGLGDIFVFLFFGLVAVLGTVYLVIGQLILSAWPPACAVGFLSVNLLVVNNVRDENEDTKSKKKTIIVRFGRKFGIVQYCTMLALSYAALGVHYFLEKIIWAFLPLIILPIGVLNCRNLIKLKGQQLNQVLGKTALFVFLFSVLLSVGIGVV